MIPEESRCPRCSDYDKVKEELENTKRSADKEVKDSLKNCESQRKKLQKQLLTAGAIAIVAGTILGKDFIDKVASYFDSFNDVKNNASSLVGMADTPQSITSEENEQPTPQVEEQEEEQEEKKRERYVPPYSGYSSLALMDNSYTDNLSSFAMGHNNSIVMQDMLFNTEHIPPIATDEMFSMPYDLLGIQPFENYTAIDGVFNLPYSSMQETPANVVPGAGTLGLLGVGLLSPRSRRR